MSDRETTPRELNKFVRPRLEAILKQLAAVREGGASMSTPTMGAEREAFVDLLLRGCLPGHFRYGSGEVTDAHERISGQVDVVIENPLFPSFPLLGTSQHRVYLIEGVALAIEVKSSCDQFPAAVESMKKFLALDVDAEWPKEIERHEFPSRTGGGGGGSSFRGNGFAIVIYKGWQNIETFAAKCKEAGVEVAMQIEPPVFFANDYRRFGSPLLAKGADALFAFLLVVNDELQAVIANSSNIYRRYGKQPKLVPGASDE